MKYGGDGRWEGRLPLHAESITWRCGVRSCPKTLATYSTTRLVLLRGRLGVGAGVAPRKMSRSV